MPIQHMRVNIWGKNTQTTRIPRPQKCPQQKPIKIQLLYRRPPDAGRRGKLENTPTADSEYGAVASNIAFASVTTYQRICMELKA